jgi:protein ImuA
MSIASTASLADLRKQIEGVDRVYARARSVLPFEVPQIDAKLPGGGLALGALHEIAGGAAGAVDGAASAALAAGIAARTGGKVLWCHYSDDLFEPALARFGLTSEQTIFFRARDERDLLSGFEEALRHGGLTAVVGELSGLSHLASQRLQLAAEQTGTMALAVRRWRRHVDAREYGLPTTSFTRWRVTEASSARLPVRGVGRGRWHLELMRCRAGNGADFKIEACDAKGNIAISSALADGSVETGYGEYRAVS